MCPRKRKKAEDIEVRAVSKKAKRSEKDVEVETPEIPAKKKPRQVKEKNRKKCKDLDHGQEEKHAQERKSKRHKRKQPAEPTAAPKPIAEAAPTEPVAETACPEHRQVGVKYKKALAFLEGFTTLSPKDSLILMRGRLLSFNRCRMNIYWKRDAVGLHHRKQKVDFAYFKFNSDPSFGSVPSHYLMAAAMKAAEMLATCLSCSG